MQKKENRGAPPDNRVVVRYCEDYDSARVQALVTGAMEELGYRPEGRVFLKPNVVYASRKGIYGSTAYTHPSVLGGTLRALAAVKGVERADVGEKTAIGYPTRLLYGYAGYYEEMRRVRKGAVNGARLGIFSIEESLRDRVFVGGLVHDNIRVARKMARADSKVYLPKLKCHCVSTMTGAVKLNIGMISDDERSLRHDFLLDDKIVDLLAAGYPDFIVMDAVDVGVGNEAVPTPRRLGLLIMGRNPMAVDLVGARLLGSGLKDVPYLKRAAERGYAPARIQDVKLRGDITTLKALDRHAKRLLPYDDEFYRWQDIERDLKRLRSPLRYYWGYTGKEGKRCPTGCVMGIKMFFAFLERFAGSDAFRGARASVLVVGAVDEEIDAKGEEVFLVGSCSRARVRNAKKVTRIDSCYATAVEITQTIRGRLGIPVPLFAPSIILPFVFHLLLSSMMKLLKLRYFQDAGYFLKHGLVKRI